MPQDTDTQVDIYDARIDGGFAPPVEPAQCSGGACKGPAAEGPPLLAPASTLALAETVGAPVGSGSAPMKVVKKKTKKLKRGLGRHKRHKRKMMRAGRK